MIFVDASALFAMVGGEEDGPRFMDILESHTVAGGAVVTSAIAIWEASVSVCKRRDIPLEVARKAVLELVATGGIEVCSIGEIEAQLALDAFGQFGKGRHPAQLNLGDCFAYACTKARQAALLYKGQDFARTDIRSAAGP